LASDGIWDVVSGRHVIDLLYADKQSHNAQDLASMLITTVLQNAKCQDNVTCIVIQL